MSRCLAAGIALIGLIQFSLLSHSKADSSCCDPTPCGCEPVAMTECCEPAPMATAGCCNGVVTTPAKAEDSTSNKESLPTPPPTPAPELESEAASSPRKSPTPATPEVEPPPTFVKPRSEAASDPPSPNPAEPTPTEPTPAEPTPATPTPAEETPAETPTPAEPSAPRPQDDVERLFQESPVPSRYSQPPAETPRYPETPAETPPAAAPADSTAPPATEAAPPSEGPAEEPAEKPAEEPMKEEKEDSPGFDELFSSAKLDRAEVIAGNWDNAALRAWRHVDGSEKWQGRAAEIRATHVVIAADDGATVAVKYEDLGDDDLHYLRREITARQQHLDAQASTLAATQAP